MRFFKFILIVGFISHLNAQHDAIVVTKLSTPDSLKTWRFENKVGVDISEVTFLNWSAGGTNSISALANYVSGVVYQKERVTWISRGVFRLGGNKQDARRIRKTDDDFSIASNLGYQTDSTSNWYYSARFNLKSQLLNGYSYPDREHPISKFFAPGYVFLGVGADYGKNIEKFSLYMSPLTYKGTFVLDEELANAGAFGVNPAIVNENGDIIKSGEQMRAELGVLLTGTYEANLFENIDFRTQAQFYTDYLNSFGNIDLNWELLVDFKVNSFVHAALGSHLIYDDDVDAFEEVDGEKVNKGPKIQWKQLLGIGVKVDF